MHGNGTAASGLPGILQLPGIDTASAMARLGLDQALYCESLGTFADLHQDTPDQIRRHALAPDIEALRLLAHTLKGEAGNLGMTAVQAAATRLEAALKPCHASEIAAFAEALAASLAQVLLDIHTHLPSKHVAVADAAVMEPDSAALAGVLTTLESQLADRNLEASNTLDRLQALLAGPEYQAFLVGLRASMVRLRYDEALQLVQAEAANRGWLRRGAP